jgi:hypothetical protein
MSTEISTDTGTEKAVALVERLTRYAAAARWAPSKHNSQPWRFSVRDGGLEIRTDARRSLPATDPLGRERLLSLGAAVHIASMAARAQGFRPFVSLLADANGVPHARLTEAGPHEASDDDRALLAAVPLRRTDRGPLDASGLPRSLPFLLQRAASEYGATLRLVSSEGDRRTFAALVERADRILVTQRTADQELAPWLRADDDPRRDGVPSSHTRGAASSYRATFVQRDFSTETSRPSQDRSGRDDPIVGILCSTGDRSNDWIAAGQALSAVLLRACVSGASASYLNQPLELPGMRSELQQALLLPGPPQVVLRIGAGGVVTAPPRRALASLLRPV